MPVKVSGISVTFPGVKALKNVELEFENGKIHALLGANGSGKSTLVKVMTGVYKPDAGARIEIDEKSFEKIENPNMAADLGIRVVHQEALMIDSLSVAECIALFRGYPVNGMRKINWKKLKDNCSHLLEQYEVTLDPDMLAGELSAAERAMVAMAVALGDEEDIKKARILILDEADAAIPEDEAEKFLKRVQLVARMGIPVIMVTHRLKDVEKIADQVSILNDGYLVYSGFMKDIDQNFIVRQMLPKTEDEISDSMNISVTGFWDAVGKKPPVQADAPVLQMKQVRGNLLKNLTLEVQPGEIVGIAGIADSGVNELTVLLGGAFNRREGEIIVAGKSLPRKLTPKRMIREGVVLVPSDRAKQGGVLNRTVKDNILLPDEKRYWGKEKLANSTTDAAIQVMDVRPGDPEMLFGKLSGGNQQKAIISKWLLMCPRVMVLDDPTYGVDPNAREKIFAALKDSAANGMGIIIFSTEPEQFVRLCSRVLVLRKGTVLCELNEEEHSLTRETIARYCYE